MKKHYPVLALCLSAALLSSCSSETAMPKTPSHVLPTVSAAPDYPQPDGSVYLNGTPSKSLLTLLKKTDLEQALVLGETNITEAQYQEIKDFTDDLVKDCTDDTGKYNAIFKWVSTNIVYDYADNAPYPVFTAAGTSAKDSPT